MSDRVRHDSVASLLMKFGMKDYLISVFRMKSWVFGKFPIKTTVFHISPTQLMFDFFFINEVVCITELEHSHLIETRLSSAIIIPDLLIFWINTWCSWVKLATGARGYDYHLTCAQIWLETLGFFRIVLQVRVFNTVSASGITLRNHWVWQL